MKYLRKILAAVLVVCMVLAMTACNSSTTPRDCVSLFTQSMNENDYRSAAAYLSDYDGFSFDAADRSNTKAMLDAVARSLKINILSDSSGMSSASLNVEITTVDLRLIYKYAAISVMESYHSSAVGGTNISDAEIREKIMQQVVAIACASDAPTVTSQCTLMLESDGGKWYIVLDGNSYNIITGYLTEANTLVESGEILTYGEVVQYEEPETVPAQNLSGSDLSPSDAA